MNTNFLKMAFVSLFAVVAICSCDEDENENGNDGGALQGNTITVAVENGSDYDAKIDSVKALIVTGEGSEYDPETNHYYAYWEGHTVAAAAYSNGKFTLKLPETVSDEYLDDEFIEELVDFDDGELPKGVTASGSELKGEWVRILAYYAGKEVGEFYYETEDCEGNLLYVDRDFSITGSYTEKDEDVNKYSLFLKKGWNLVYERNTEINDDREEEERTTTPAPGVKWNYSEYGNYD
jgi:hypothetical protein